MTTKNAFCLLSIEVAAAPGAYHIHFRTCKVIYIAQNCKSCMCIIWKAVSASVIKKILRDPFSKVSSAARQPDRCWHQLSSFTLMEMFHSAKHYYCFHYISSPYTYCAEWLIQENWTVAWTGKFFTCYLHIWSFTIIPTQKNVELRLQLIFRIQYWCGLVFYSECSFHYAENYFWPHFRKLSFSTSILVLGTATSHSSSFREKKKKSLVSRAAL